MSAPQSIVSTVSTTNANVDTTSSSGKPSLTASIVFPLQPSLMKRFSACTEDWAQSSPHWIRSRGSCVLPTCQIQDFSATCYGQTQTRMCRDGARMIEGSVSPLARRSWVPSPRSMISIWYAGPTRWLRMGMSSSLRDNWSPCLAHLTIAGSLIMLGPWCRWMKLWCVLSRYWSLLRRNRSSLMGE